MGRFTGKTCRLLSMLSLTASFFLVEITVGYITNSLALVGDSYHMLSDIVALFIGFASVRISKWRSQKNTYGWARAEVLGAMVNAVFLVALCFTIFVEALQRLINTEKIHNPDLLLIVGGIGLAVNVLGLFLFHGHGHGHSHGGHGHSHGISDVTVDATQDEDGSVHMNHDMNAVANSDESAEDSDDEDDQLKSPKLKSSAQLNMRAVFLHVLGDALGSVIVIISALVIKYAEGDWRYKMDPAMSLALVIIILSTSIPLLKESALILLQTVPTHIQVQDLQAKLVKKVNGVLAIHEFHIWQLAGNRIIASAHIRCQNLRDYMRIAEDVKSFFHDQGIHSTTIQPEFVEEVIPEKTPSTSSCLLDCYQDSCIQRKCCCNTTSDDGWLRRRSERQCSEELPPYTEEPPEYHREMNPCMTITDIGARHIVHEIVTRESIV